MYKLIDQNRGIIFWKNLGLVLLITSIPTAFIGAFLYYIGTSRIETEVNRAYQAQLNLSIQQLNDYLNDLEHSVVRLAFDNSMDESLKQLDPIQDFTKTNDLMKSLSLLTKSNSLINSVCLYLPDQNKLIGDQVGYQSIRTAEDQQRLSSLLNKDRSIYWDYSLPKIDQPQSQNTAIIIKLPGGQIYGTFGAFIIYLDQKTLDAMVQQLSFGQGSAFIFNENGDYLTTTHSTGQLALADALKNRIISETSTENRFKFDSHNTSYSVSYGKISKLGSKWTVVTATPVSEITAPVTSLTNVILWISVVGLGLGLLLSWFASNRMYDPINRLKKLVGGSLTKSDETNEIVYIENQWKKQMQEQQSLALRVKQSIPALRESFLLQFLQGNLVNHTEAEVINQLKQLEWQVENKKFAVMVAQLHGLSELGTRFPERDAQLVSFAASNIMLELCAEKLSMVHVINFQDLSVGVFLVVDHHVPNEEIAGLLNKLAHDYIAAVNNVLRLKATIVTSKISDSLVQMPRVLEQARKALRFRDLHSSNQLLDMNQMNMGTNNQKQFPVELERQIVHTVSMGLEEEAVRLIKEFILVLQNNYNTELMVHQGMMKLLGALHDMMIKHNVNLYAIYDGNHMYEQLMQLSEPDEMVEWFQFKLIDPFIRTLSNAYDSNLREMIDGLLQQIQDEILLDKSLEVYAEQLGMNASKLSRVFRDITGTNFIDTVIRLRMEKCKELLVSTDMKINDIAAMLHYQPSHLIRLFKKCEGITPRQYREKHTSAVG